MSYLEQLKALRSDGALATKHPGTAPPKLPKGGFVSFGSACSGHMGETNRSTPCLPETVEDGLIRLRAMPAPRITRPHLWPAIVADALRLARSPWAARALTLGWTPLDLWGCWPFEDGDDPRDGLAVWLGGRAIVALEERLAIARQGKNIACHYRPASCGNRIFLWAIGGQP